MSTRQLLAIVLCALATALAVGGCNPAPSEPAPHSAPDASAAPMDAGPGGTGAEAGGSDAQAPPSPQCFTNPTTYLEIINACTDAQAVDKQVDLSSMNLADGGLQPLP